MNNIQEDDWADTSWGSWSGMGDFDYLSNQINDVDDDSEREKIMILKMFKNLEKKESGYGKK